jgi:hypothetical protein
VEVFLLNRLLAQLQQQKRSWLVLQKTRSYRSVREKLLKGAKLLLLRKSWLVQPKPAM